MAKKACKNCKLIVTGSECVLCKRNQFTTNLQGTLIVLDASKSKVAKDLSITVKGEYAIKIR